MFYFSCNACNKSIKFENEAWKAFVAQISNDSRCPHCDIPLTPPSVFTQTLEHIEYKPPIKIEIDQIKEQAFNKNMVEHPPHYTAGGIECIDAIMAAVEGLTPQEAVCVANVIKYTWRFKHKNGKQDLEKAQWYLKRLTDLLGG